MADDCGLVRVDWCMLLDVWWSMIMIGDWWFMIDDWWFMADEWWVMIIK